ncbi:ParA family protein, partial [Veillonella parvula]|uniref:ParA family protein n=1 Tax=Veillonella parvula TaxID=29466 RepID=UPI00241F6F9B
MSIIAFINQKGGVGKSLLSFNIGVILASQNKKVLFVDLDAQSTLTDFAIPNEKYNLTLFDLLKRKNVKVQDVIVHTEKYDIIPVNIEVANPNLKI